MHEHLGLAILFLVLAVASQAPDARPEAAGAAVAAAGSAGSGR